MNYLRAVLSGVILWIFVALSFFILEHTPIVKDSLNIQTALICILIVFYSIFGASFYYQNGISTSGIPIGIIMSLTAILLDILIFVPFVEIPKGHTYQDFFSNPLLWLLAVLNVLTVYFYWKKRFESK
ncbi:DUF5367 family protein [Flavobacterium chungbukense]|uniref:Integral membrane protein n=1 Tax=Flavobacterium chungbukense TaxID=877464 RepID=A0ABP7YJR9_9FLAO|nr:DUF5367 family protein [Flavobacterium chungbukense]MCC4920076.1 DUF5367 domain-containing protein [Flavobacterium chungbukense]